MQDYIEYFLSKFDGVQERGDTGWMAQCPAHSDREPSLHISVVSDGSIQCHCHGGCPVENVLAKAGLTKADFYPPRAVPEIEEDTPPVASRHIVYSWLLAQLELSSEHASSLVLRGLLSDGLHETGYCTLANAGELANRAYRQFGEAIYDIPGFARGDNGPRLVQDSGLIIPVTDSQGHIIALKVRKDSGPRKYIWFSGNGSPSVGQPVHVTNWKPGSKSCILTEGPLKANVIAHFDPSEPVLAVGGVSAWKKALPVLKELGIERIHLAFDMDWTTKAGVAKAHRAATRGLQRYTPNVWIGRWNINKGKGLDDLYLAGGEPDWVQADKIDSSAWLPESINQDDQLTWLGDVESEPVSWLWDKWIPHDAITIIDGDPGEGKSLLTLDLAARLTAGRPLPGMATATPACNVLFISGEDSVAKTLRPRFELAGGDVSKLAVWEGTYDSEHNLQLPIFPEDLDKLERHIVTTRAKLVVVDPIMAYISSTIDSHKDTDIRRLVGRLKQIAEEYGVTVVIVRHLNKAAGGKKAIYRGGGSIGIVAQARSALFVARAGKEDHVTINSSKSNWGPKPKKGLGFTIEAEETKVGSQPKLKWIGEVETTIEQQMGEEKKIKSPVDLATKEGQAAAWLIDYLAEDARLSADVITQGEKKGFGKKLLYRAKDALEASGIYIVVEQEGRKWFWRIINGSTPNNAGRNEENAAQPLNDLATGEAKAIPPTNRQPRKPDSEVVRSRRR